MTHACPECGTVLQSDAPEGLCSGCLLRKGLGVSDDQLQAAASTGLYQARFPGPTSAELTPHFPQLEILELLGQGGMGAVYKARQPKLDRLVALKILPPDVGRDPHFAERFQREARALARLDHPHIVGIFDFGETISGMHYFLMEYVDGGNLRQLLRAERLPWEQTLTIVAQVCEALQYAHDQGVVHRDVKPENILLDRKNRLKIADFGLAKLLGRDSAELRLTATHQAMGTPHYMAPEQIEKPLEVDHRADIYALGVVFYEMLTGQLPLGRFPAPSQKLQVHERFDKVVLRALERDRERRYQGISDLKTDLESITNALQVSPPQLRPVPSRVADTTLVPTAPGAARAARNARIPTSIQQQMMWPAIGLLFAGSLTFLSLVVNALHLFLNHGKSQEGAPFGQATELVVSVWCGSSLVIVPVMILGALRMRELHSYRLAVTAGLLAMLPCAWSFPINLTIGIWALAALTRPEVRRAFCQSEGRNREVSEMNKTNTIALPADTGFCNFFGSTSGWACVCCLIGTFVSVFLFSFILLEAIQQGLEIIVLATFLVLLALLLAIGFLQPIPQWLPIAIIFGGLSIVAVRVVLLLYWRHYTTDTDDITDIVPASVVVGLVHSSVALGIGLLIIGSLQMRRVFLR